MESKNNLMKFIATIPPYVNHVQELANSPYIHELRFNTIMPIGETKEAVVRRLLSLAGEKPIWLDLKTRQLRIAKFAYLPYSFVELSHQISVNLPAKIYFKDCVSEIAQIVDGNKLILSRRPQRVVGSGEPVNILDPSLRIEGFLTEDDKEYIETFKSFGQHNYLLSFFESFDDVAEVLKLDPLAHIIAKIESKRGMEFVRNFYTSGSNIRLMAARDDLYINLGFSEIMSALKEIIQKDKNAIVASHLFTSLENYPSVSLQDISDFNFMQTLGYTSFMLSDGLCFSEKAFRGVLNVLQSVDLNK
jgi:hypothetical protein